MLLTTGLILGGASLAGGLINAGLQGAEAHNTRKFNSLEAEKQRQWEETMSNTAFQRAAEDMRKAGLNPAMMYAGNGGAASTPSGASANTSTPRVNSIVADIGNLMNSITNAKALDLQTNRKSNIKEVQEMYDNAGELLRAVVKETRYM